MNDLKRWKQEVEQALVEQIEQFDMPKRLRDAMMYSLDAGGKRIRPALIFAVLESYGVPTATGKPVAAALEMIHTYSLIHDDLPAMDDDDLRRGRPTSHKQFDEATAILAGDALLTNAFTVLLRAEASPEQLVTLTRLMSEASGATGMVGGQLDDMLAEERTDVTLEDLQSIHARKTGALLVYALEAGAVLAQAPASEREALRRFGAHIGVAFQIQDDILDVVGEEGKIGKKVGSDETNGKTTYPKLLGLEGAKQALDREVQAAQQALADISVNTEKLEGLLHFVVKRDH